MTEKSRQGARPRPESPPQLEPPAPGLPSGTGDPGANPPPWVGLAERLAEMSKTEPAGARYPIALGAQYALARLHQMHLIDLEKDLTGDEAKSYPATLTNYLRFIDRLQLAGDPDEDEL